MGSTLAMVKPSDPVLSSSAKRLIRAVLGSGRVTGNTDITPRKFRIADHTLQNSAYQAMSGET